MSEGDREEPRVMWNLSHMEGMNPREGDRSTLQPHTNGSKMSDNNNRNDMMPKVTIYYLPCAGSGQNTLSHLIFTTTH